MLWGRGWLSVQCIQSSKNCSRNNYCTNFKEDKKEKSLRNRGLKHGKNLSKSMNGKDMGIPTYFQWTGKKYSHTLWNLWKLVSNIWELCGFLNSKTIVWEYISSPHNIPLVWNFTLPILCGLFGVCNNF